MRKLLVFLGLLLIGGASAISASVELNRDQVGLGDKVIISYSFSLDEPSLTNFSARANDILVFNHTTLASGLSSQYEWDVSNTPAGNYIMRFEVFAENGETASTTANLEITAEALLTMVTSDTVYAFDNMTTKVYNLQNMGNIPLEVSIIPTRIYSASPLYFKLGISETQDITVQIQRTESLSASLAVRGENGTLRCSLNLNINIVVPSVSVNLTDVYTFASEGFSVLHVKVTNDGNIDQNFSFLISTGEETFERFLEMEASESVEHNFTLPTSVGVKSVEMNYIDSDGSTSIVSLQLTEGTFFDRLMDMLGDSTMRGVLITFLVLVVLYLVWKVVRR
jgi:hypothetical protein